MKLLDLLSSLVNRRWAIGFVQGGMQSIFEDTKLKIDWVSMPKDRWYADPFILDVTENEILLLVEDLSYATNKGVISLLHIDKKTKQIISRKTILELPTHLSFPIILRKDEHIYIYPESRFSGKLNLYEFNPTDESVTYISTLCDQAMWDSAMVDFFGEKLLFTATKDNYQLDIYHWKDKEQRYAPYQVIHSDKPNCRLGGAPFEFNGHYYQPFQDCSKEYGGALDIKRIDFIDSTFRFTLIKHLESTNRKYPLGLHTLNEYKGVAVIDVNGWRYGKIGAFCHSVIEFFRKLKNK